MKKLILAVAMATISAGAMAQAPEQFYVEAGYGWVTYKESGYSATPGIGSIKFGVNYNPYLAAEFLAATTINNANFNVSGIPVTVKVDNAYGAYLKAKYDVSPEFQVFVRGGVTNATVSGYALGRSASSSGTDFSYGAGAQYSFTKTVYGQFDYMSYYNRDGISVQGPTVSVGVKF